MKSAFALAVLAATLVAGIGHNNWDQPCFSGECAYDLPDHKGQSGTVKLASFAKSPHAIADITPAAGWVVLDCDPNALQQEIRLVCKSDDAEGAGCNHFFDGGHGPVNKYLRLPESCSSSPFGRVVDFRVHEDQSVPSHHQVTRRDGSAPQVFAVNIDTEFTEIDYSKYGDVHFVAYGASAPGLDTNFAIPSEVDDHAVVDAFLEKALQELIDSSSVPKNQVVAVVYPNAGLVYYPSGKASTTPYKFDEPAGSKKSTGINFGSEKNTWAKFELKTGDTDLACKKDLGKGSFAQVGATVTGKLESYFWGTLGWGGAASGKNGALESVKGFWNDLSAHMRHEATISISLLGKIGWEQELGPWAIPGVTGLEFGIANLGLMGAVKLEASVTAEAVMELTAKFQYGLDRGLVTVPPKPGKPDNPGLKLESSAFNGSMAATGKAHVAFEAAATPKLLIGASAGVSKFKIITSAFLGFETKFTAEAEASKEFANADWSSKPVSSSSSRPSSPKSPRKSRRSEDADSEAGYSVKIGLDAHVGAETKFWGIGPSGKWSFFTYEYQVTCGGSMCKKDSKKRRSSLERRDPVNAKTKSLKCPTVLKPLKSFLSSTPAPAAWTALKTTTFA